MMEAEVFDETLEKKIGLQNDESGFLLVLPAHERGIEVGTAAGANCYKNTFRKVRLRRIRGDDQRRHVRASPADDTGDVVVSEVLQVQAAARIVSK